MDDLISRQAAIKQAVKESQADGAYGYMDTKSIVDMLSALPSIQPKRGKWKTVVCDGVELVACTECGYTGAFWTFNYCPICGADMRG